jgi:hypothetical protein
MKGLSVFAVLALAACTWAGFTTKTHELKGRGEDDFLAAVEAGAIVIPEGVTVSLALPDHRLPVLSVSGEEAAVDAALGSIAAWDKAPTQLVVKIEFRKGDKVISAPIVRVIAGKPATVTQSIDGSPNHSSAGVANLIKSGIRVCALMTGKYSFELRATLIANDKRLILPFALSSEEDVAIEPAADGSLFLVARNVKTKDVRKAQVSADWKPLVGLLFTFRAELAAN